MEGADVVTKAYLDESLVGLKTDVAGLKTDVAGMKTDVGELKKSSVRHEAAINAQALRLDRHEQLLVEIRSAMVTKSDLARVNETMEKVLRMGELYDRKALTHGPKLIEHGDTLRAHERRISALEAGRRGARRGKA